MNKQVLDRSQMEHLCELGIDTTQATMCQIKQHDDDGTSKDILCMHDEFCYEFSSLDPEPTFTLQDILDLLPNLIESQDEGNNYWLEFGTAMEDEEWWYIRYMSVYGVKLNYEEDEHLIDAAYEMLCWCIENEYVRTESN